MVDKTSNRRIMFSAFVISISLLKLVSSCSTFESKDVCKQGWFGSSCQYRCRCEWYQCTVNGTCQPGYKCQGGWFGPECQYVDLAYNKSEPVLDGKDNSCTTRQSTIITVPLNATFNSYQISWMRININNSWTENFVQNLKIKFGGNQTFNCINAKNSIVDKHTLDVHCDLPDTVHSVTLEGPAVSYLCSVYVSGGRNLALGQATNQSSTYKTGLSSCAVDGDTNDDFGHGKTCSHTSGGNNDRNPTWRLNLTTPGLVTRFLIYNRGNLHNGHRNFQLESFDSTNKKVFSYHDKGDQHQREFQNLSSSVTSPVSSLVIKIPEIEMYTFTILILCEVEMFGDSSCPEGKYGRECEFKCNCKDDSDCFVSTGGCPAGCAAGYQGESCSQACEMGKYGQDCILSCSDFCVPTNQSEVSSCDHVNGSCLYGCLPGYPEPNCDIITDEAHERKYSQNMTTTVLICVLLVVVIALVIVVLFVLSRRRRFKRRAKGQKIYVNDVVALPQPHNKERSTKVHNQEARTDIAKQLMTTVNPIEMSTNEYNSIDDSLVGVGNPYRNIQDVQKTTDELCNHSKGQRHTDEVTNDVIYEDTVCNSQRALTSHDQDLRTEKAVQTKANVYDSPKEYTISADSCYRNIHENDQTTNAPYEELN